MRIRPLGWATGVAILQLTGSVVEEHADHVVIRSPHNPDFHWGNCLFVTDDDAVDDAERWWDIFGRAFPEADWVAIGLTRMPDDRAAWAKLGLELEVDDVLTTRTLPRRLPRAPGYTVRRLTAKDWGRSAARRVAENRLTQNHDPAAFERFATAQARTHRELSERDLAAWFGAFANDTLVAELGIVRCGTTARYQGISTDEEHRGRGLASHLLGVAAQWAADRGCDRWVIVTGATNPAGRVYRSVGFVTDGSSVEAYRRPPS